MSSFDTDSNTSTASLVELYAIPLVPRHVAGATIHITKFENEIQSLHKQIADAEQERNAVFKVSYWTEVEIIEDLVAFGSNLNETDKMKQLATLSSFGRQSLYELKQIWDRVEKFFEWLGEAREWLRRFRMLKAQAIDARTRQEIEAVLRKLRWTADKSWEGYWVQHWMLFQACGDSE